ncbi:hypothetical protein HMN09_01236500 [Mycena chlorophos]|uniref:Uncharacterized protein n=1 Tax=Mycena chlorophos TaxID=658473 RepID=A0A8H6S2M4_MYCCL|nr:hypothetical protein HMN09_01236500 [Mycena chlorophos]
MSFASSDVELNPPAFPPEIERYIFIFAAERDRGTAALLLRVAHRVRIWIEPLLYHIVDTSYPAVYDAFMRTAIDNPDALRIGVRGLMVSNLYFEDDKALAKFYEAIALCKNLERFTIVQPLTLPSLLLPILADLRILRLVIGLDKLLTPTIPTPEAAQSLCHVTHLEVFGSLFGHSALEEAIQEALIAMPSLTHLAYTHPPDDLDAWLEKLPRLQVFLIAGASSPRDYLLEDEYRDQRIVVTYWERWDEGASYSEGYWDRAERFLEKKRLREIPETEFRAVYDGPELPPSPPEDDPDEHEL